MVSFFKKLLLTVLPALALAGTAVSVALVNRPAVQTFSSSSNEATVSSLQQNHEASFVAPVIDQQNSAVDTPLDPVKTTQIAALADQNPTTGQQPVDVYANFKKYYREPNGYTQAANVDLSGMGSVAALSLSGFLPTTVDRSKPIPVNGTSISITEVVLVDKDGAVLSDYKVRKVNYASPSTTNVASIGTGAAANNYGLSDDVYAVSPANSLLATNISANLSFSLEIELARPTVLSEIKIAQVLPATPAGTVLLGSVGLLTTDAVYRLYNYTTPTDLPESTGTAVSFSLGKARENLRWVKFSDVGDQNYAYVLVPKAGQDDTYWVGRKVMFVTDDEHYMHITPFAIGGKLNVQLIETKGTEDTTDDTLARITYMPPIPDGQRDAVQVDFLRQINDPEFWKETLLRLRALPNNRITEKQLVTADMLRRLPSTTQAGFIFTIKMTGRDGAVAENSLSNMFAFALFGQMAELVFNSVTPAGTSQNPFTFSYHINPFIQQWLSAFAGISRITFAAAGTTNAPRDTTNFLITGDFADARWLSSMTRLATFNLTSYANYEDETAIDEQMQSAEWFSEFLSQQISSSRSPVILIPKNSANSNNPAIDTKIASGKITEGVNSSVAPPFYFYTVTTAQYIEYTNIPEPRIYFDPINGLTSNKLLVNDSTVDLFVKDSNLYWNYNQAYTITNGVKTPSSINKNFIYAFYPKEQKFVTEVKKRELEAAGASPDDFKIIDQLKIQNAPSEVITERPAFETLLNPGNFNQGLKKYLLDEVSLESVLYDSQMVLVTDELPKVTYFFENETSVHLFSDLPTLLKFYSLDRWAGLSIDQVATSDAPRTAYEEYKLKGLQSFADPDYAVYPLNPPVVINGTTTLGVADIEIYETKPYWKLPDNIKPEQIRYFDGKSYYTELDQNMDWDAGVYALKSRDGYPSNIFNTRVTPQHFALNDKSLASLPTASLNINNQDRSVILSAGDSFYDFNLNEISYVVEGLGVPQWYTEFDQAEKETLKTGALLYTVTKESRRQGQRAPIVLPKNGSLIRMAGSDETFPSVLINGQWRFLITRTQFDSLNYVDRTGAYYASLPSVSTIINEALSTVAKTYNESYIEEPDARQNIAQSFEVLGNVKAAKEGFTIDGKRYDFTIKDGKAYIEPALFSLIGFVANPVDRVYASSFAQMTADQARGAFSANKNDDAAIISGFKGVQIAPADGERTTVEVRDLNGFLRTTTVVGKMVNGTVVYEFSDVAVGALIKYKGAGNRYLASLDNLQDSDGLVSQVLPFTVESLDASKAHQGLAELADEQIRIVIAASVLGGLGLLGAAAGFARLFYLLRKRAK